MKITIEAHAEGRTLYERFGRKRHVCEAKLGCLTATEPNKPAAAEALKAELLALTLAPRPIVRFLKDGRVAVATLAGATPDGVIGWGATLYGPDGRSYGGMGADLKGCSLSSTPAEVETALTRALDQYVASINEAVGGAP